MATKSVLVTGDPVKAAARLVRMATAQELENLPAQREATQKVIAELKRIEEGLCGVERGMSSELRSRLDTEKKKMAWLNKVDKYPRFSLDPLKWRDERGFPQLAVFTLHSNLFQIYTRNNQKHWYQEPQWSGGVKIGGDFLFGDIEECYEDVVALLPRFAKDRHVNRIKLEARLTVLIPDTVKEKIKHAKEQEGFKDIYIIAEAPKWDLEQTVVMPNTKKDPLVIGRDEGGYWLIAMFDPTILEDYIATFCGKK